MVNDLALKSLVAFALLFFGGIAPGFGAEEVASSGLIENLFEVGQQQEIASPIKILLFLSALSLIPLLLIALTSFTRIVIVLSILRQAIGMQETPPNIVLICISLFMTLLVMNPILKDVNRNAIEPYLKGQITEAQTMGRIAQPIKAFMQAQTHPEDLELVMSMTDDSPDMSLSANEVDFITLIPAFMLSELRQAFQIGFFIFVPFLLIDLITSAILMSLGMMMVPPVMLSLPIKILVFVLIDGWNLVIKVLLSTIVY